MLHAVGSCSKPLCSEKLEEDLVHAVQYISTNGLLMNTCRLQTFYKAIQCIPSRFQIIIRNLPPSRT